MTLNQNRHSHCLRCSKACCFTVRWRHTRGGNIQQIIGTLYHELDYAVFKQAWQCVVQPQYDQCRFEASAIVVLEAMPLTPNGKVGRRKLPAPEVIRAELEGAFVAPKNPLEEALATIWREILGVEKIGTADNFFELGGHSLLATQLVSRLREVFKVDLPLRLLFEAPTIRQLAPGKIAQEPQPGIIERAARILNKLEAMSPEELERALLERRRINGEA